MIHIAKAVALLISVLAVLFTAYFTLSSNRYAGIYHADGDSIAMPLFETAGALLVIFVLFLTGFVITSLSAVRKRTLHFLGVGLFILAGLVAGGLAWSWFIPDHYSIACSYIFVAVVAVTLATMELRKPPAIPAPKRTAPKRAPRARR